MKCAERNSCANCEGYFLKMCISHESPHFRNKRRPSSYCRYWEKRLDYWAATVRGYFNTP